MYILDTLFNIEDPEDSWRVGFSDDIVYTSQGEQYTITDNHWKQCAKLYLDKLSNNYIKIENDAVNTKPMKAKKPKSLEDITYPVYIQPKLNGIRVLATNGNLYSSGSKLYLNMIHISKCVKDLLQFLPDKAILDGEVYNHRIPFNKIRSLVLSTNVITTDLTYYVFDFKCSVSYTFHERIKMLNEAITLYHNYYNNFNIQLLITWCVKDEDNIKSTFNYCINNGYEGIVIKRSQGLYKEGYNTNTLKMKLYDDLELPVVKVDSNYMYLSNGNLNLTFDKSKDPSVKVGDKVTVRHVVGIYEFVAIRNYE